MTKYHIIHRVLSDEQRDKINLEGWVGEIGTAYMRAERGDIAKAVELGMYQPVAVVEADDLEHAYFLTNHVDRDWTENPGIVKHAARVKSSSVGDIFVDDETGEAQMVASFGFDLIDGPNVDTIRSLAEAWANA